MNYGRWNQVGIVIGLLGIVVALIGFFPTLAGLEANPGFGLVQVLTVLAGFSLLILGAYIFVAAVLYPKREQTLAQQIGVRLSLTGLLAAAAAGLADWLGYGSNSSNFGELRATVGSYQALGMIGSFFIAALGVMIFAVGGQRDDLLPVEFDDSEIEFPPPDEPLD